MKNSTSSNTPPRPRFDRLEQRVGELGSENQRKGDEIRKLKTTHQTGNNATERRVVWDEATIAEHDKDRGTRMKVDEPKTPYHHSTGSFDQADAQDEAIPFMALGGEAANAPPAITAGIAAAAATATMVGAALTRSLATPLTVAGAGRAAGNAAATIPLHDSPPPPLPPPPSSQVTDMDAVSMRLQQKAKAEEFERLRKQHYNMADALRRRNEEAAEADEDGDE